MTTMWPWFELHWHRPGGPVNLIAIHSTCHSQQYHTHVRLLLLPAFFVASDGSLPTLRTRRLGPWRTGVSPRGAAHCAYLNPQCNRVLEDLPRSTLSIPTRLRAVHSWSGLRARCSNYAHKKFDPLYYCLGTYIYFKLKSDLIPRCSASKSILRL